MIYTIDEIIHNCTVIDMYIIIYIIWTDKNIFFGNPIHHTSLGHRIFWVEYYSRLKTHGRELLLESEIVV